MTLSIFSQNSMSFPEIPELFNIPENPWLSHDRGNPVIIYYKTQQFTWQYSALTKVK